MNAKEFQPSWFAGIMGTGIFSITSLIFSQYFSFLRSFSYFLFYLNILLFIIFLSLWIVKFFIFKKDFLKDFYHPLVSNFFSAFGAAMLVISANIQMLFNNSFSFSFGFWIAGTFFTILFGIITPFIMFKENHIKLDHICPAFFIPPVAFIVIPIPGSFFINHFQGWVNDFIIFINYFSWGTGFFLFLIMSAISMYRFILHHPLPNIMAPTIWVNLGPIGAGTTALIKLTKASNFIISKDVFYGFSFLLWGYGIWWLLMAISLTIYYSKKMKIPFTLSWFAFIFPTGAYITATHTISLIFKIKFIDYFGFIIYFLLVFFWFATFFNLLNKKTGNS
ncbi:C4-dicarboxylate transporter/malic acid transport protein [Marinitoga piezophila KA3]|uniref:C4-dicarboxylate transporter/malic acid transport protein n=1 Tax=Marinitoga piezophila (strain DSM 14283 / JCM 11233 / KA3) TaxID=443254 RepID=H2J2N2_MARPK|nr:tellurite-resistance/dicarboxylate transporter [Marinitoga piezophila]AEX84476.1 C4-dicarboxylate transporter/malic acid transport protein [Marinitoga piezophila KA3]